MKIKPNQKTPGVRDLSFTVELDGKEVCDLIAFFGNFSGKPDLYYRKEICTKWYDALDEIYKKDIKKIDTKETELNDSQDKVYTSMQDETAGYG